MRVIILLVSALALTVAEDKASAETTDDGTKEDLSPEASGRIFGLRGSFTTRRIMGAHWEMRVIILLVSALALTVAEDKASAETTDDGTKEDLSPEASGRIFGLGLDNILHNKFGSWGGYSPGYYGGGGYGSGGYGGGGGYGGSGYGNGGYGGYDTGYGGSGYGGYGNTGYGSKYGGYGGYGSSGYGGYGLNSGYSGLGGYGGYGNTGYGGYGGLGSGIGGYGTGYGTNGAYRVNYVPYSHKYRK